jgi:mannose-1-phosphate guanylyltransferase
MVVLPADHHIARPTVFLELLERAIAFAHERGGLLTLGIVPTSPHTGYGYIESRAGTSPAKGIWEVERFVEKPDRARAEEFLRRKNFFWNSGIFVWRLSTLVEAFEAFLPEAWEAISGSRTETELERAYASVPAVPIDIGVLEKAENIFVLPADIGWSDVGSWDALFQLKRSGPDAQAFLSGEVRTIDSQRCLVRVPQGKRVALVGVEDLIVVEHEGTLLITRRDKDQLVRSVSEKFGKDG